MKKTFIFILILITTCTCAFGAKYSVTTSGVVKTPQGNVMSSPSNGINQNYYNNYNAQNYITSNAVNNNSAEIIEFVMDYSGSMANWIVVAKNSMATIVSQIPSSTKVGFRVFGHESFGHNQKPSTVQDVKTIQKKGNKMNVVTLKSYLGSTSGYCTATQQVAPVMSANTRSILNGMNSVNIGGSTPLVYALDRTVNQDFANLDTVTSKKIVLITDGGENCGGDPCEFAKRLMSKRSDIHIDVVLVSAYSHGLTCLATTTGGHFYNINNLSDFSSAINKSIQSKPTEVSNSVKYENDQKYEYINNLEQ